MTTTLSEPGPAQVGGQADGQVSGQTGPAPWHAGWLVAFGPDADRLAWSKPSGRWRSAHTAFAVNGLEGSDLRLADDGQFVAVFSGLLTNARELQRGATQDDAARIALRLVKSRGVEGFSALRGPFAVIVWDRLAGTLLVGRDQVGLEPIFYARADRGWLLARSPDVLVSQPGVSRDPDRVALSEWLCGWFPAVEDTTYRAVKRIPPGSSVLYRGADATVHRYWDPFPEAQPVEWLKEKDLEAFEPRLVQAVGRSIGDQAPALFLSGGLDSISVAVTAADLASQSEGRGPLALSLVFPDQVSSEEPIQRGVAARLGLEQALVPFAEAVGPRGLLAEALALSAVYPQPVWNMWAPAYGPLAQLAAARGRGVILTGRGGDEWLTISPYLLADQLKRGDFVGAARLIRMRQQSNSLAGLRASARLVWQTAGRPLASAALDAIAPALWHQRRRRRLLGERPGWVAPDPAIRRAMDERIERWIDPARPAGGFYQRESRTALRHPAVTHDMEETQEFGRRHGLRVLHPFWDVDLIELLHRVPPRLLMRDGRSKWLLRRKIGERLPGLGLERRGKTSAAHVFRGLLEREAPMAWNRLGGAPALERMGVVRTADMDGRGDSEMLAATGGAGRLYTLLNLEAWVQPRG
jgi:asparagine synthase (glutamine-hydrolysing)